MNRALIFLLLLALLAAPGTAQDQGTLLTPGGAGEAQWKPLIDALAAKGTVVGLFTERRFFPFRSQPMVLKGVLRISPERGLSLQYTQPEESVLVADAAGLLLRDRDGGTRVLPSGDRETGAIGSLLPIMRFDLPALYPRFVIRARRTGGDWSFEFTPREPAGASALGTIAVAGADSEVRHLEFRRSASQRVEIDVSDTRTGAPFSAADLRQFFR
jgi:hypothetical protein